MPFATTQQHEFDGQSLPYLGVRLITSPLFSARAVAGNVVLNVTPYGFDADGNVIRPTRIVDVDDGEGNVVQVVEHDPSQDTSRIYGDAYTEALTDPRKAQALALISQGIQILIEAEGL